MKIVLSMLCVMSLFFAGCTSKESPGCQAQKFVTNSITEVVAQALQCTNKAAMEADIGAIAQKYISLCEAQPAGVVGNMLCPKIADEVMGLAKSQIPAAWGCSAQAVGDQASSLIIGACVGVVPFKAMTE